MRTVEEPQGDVDGAMGKLDEGLGKLKALSSGIEELRFDGPFCEFRSMRFRTRISSRPNAVIYLQYHRLQAPGPRVRYEVQGLVQMAGHPP